MADLELPEFAEIESARTRIGPHAHWTPLLSSRSIGELSNTDVWLKCENLQKAGAFKFRGACNAVFSLSDAEAAKGIITHSSGTHAQAVALAARAPGDPLAAAARPLARRRARRRAAVVRGHAFVAPPFALGVLGGLGLRGGRLLGRFRGACEGGVG